ncbi:hypothetical protein VPHD249_0175 [Vibrio phage D249]|nr:hypothetical protein SIPHO036v1_50010 [Vibrio phage 70E38.1]QZI88066.1 hypothetical protein SIPHO041v1_p0155 [Vibrio phage 234P1]QZI88240.1 hypothetical protein SIPHO035v1_p0149 [Vibrio phage 234P7B]QZI88606.1 hypothetical protein SIPHO037v1_p0165 [Vibrio phage 70E35.2]QZI88791.1 hypothetical protein SIPHO039v1_p0162 [Vibrio phage 70E35.5a]QZI88974.1 hypothetical protein SIPHO040v1_p0161 [Vibrio phage 70E35.6]QZI89047.1 hypothetical protein SIPHO042v1_p0050 [Vibrio phage 70E37.1]QZI89239.
MKTGLYQVIKLSEVRAIDLTWDDLNEAWYIKFREVSYYISGDYHELYDWNNAVYTFLLMEDEGYETLGTAYLKSQKPE